MTFSLKLRKAVRKLVAMIPPHRRYTKVFEIKFQLTTGKTPLDHAINECYVNAVYDKVESLVLDDFFKWAEVKELALDIFFSQASYPSAVELDLDMFFQQAAFPKAEQYQLEEFFEHAANLTHVAPEVEAAEHGTIEATFEVNNEEEAESEEIDEVTVFEIEQEEEKEIVMDYAPYRMTRSMSSCSMQAEKPFRGGLVFI